MRGRGKPRLGPNSGYNTGSGHISIVSKDFDVSGTIRASTLTTSTINCIDTLLNTSNNLYVQDSGLYLNGKPIGSISIDPYELTVSTVANKTYLSYTSNYSFTVPPGVKVVDFQVWGAGGGYYGNGAYIHVQALVTPGDIYNIVVGSGGNSTNKFSGATNANTGNFGDGGDSDLGSGYLGGAAGGSYSGILTDSLIPIVIAGAGGAASYSTISGAYSHAGLIVGYPGDGRYGGLPGTQTSGGVGGGTTNNSIANPSKGANGAYYSTITIGISKGGDSISGNGGGGGGGGYYSGGGGAANFINTNKFSYGGGGGSSYIEPSLTTIIALDGTQSNIYMQVEEYQPGVALGGTYTGTNGAYTLISGNYQQITTSGGPGLVVISYYASKNLFLSSPYPAGRFIVDNIQAISTVTENITFNTQKPLRIYAQNNDKYVFNAIGADQYFTVPDGVNNLNVKLWGAAGYGLGPEYEMGFGGYGGFVSGCLSVTPGDILTIVVGSHGDNYDINTPGHPYGNGGLGFCRGGGRSAIQNNYGELVTAGGGGGASIGNKYSSGGAGGNYSGQAGILTKGSNSVGYGGTQNSPGLGGYSAIGNNYTGHDANWSIGGSGAYCSSVAAFISTSGGGGGGGFYGGGGGGAGETKIGGPGGGGSSYLDNLIDSFGISGNYYRQYITDPDYQDNAGLSDGLVIISYPANLVMEYTDPLVQIGVSRANLPLNGWLAGGQGGGNYGITYSLDGYAWNYVKSGGFPLTTNGIAFNQTYWVAVGSLSTLVVDSINSIQTSVNGLDWTNVVSGGFCNGYGVAWGNGLWVAVGDGNYNVVSPPTLTSIQVSTDGQNWSNTSNSFLATGRGVAYNKISKLYVAVGNTLGSALHTILYSRDAITWNQIASGGFNSYPYTQIWNTYYPGSNGLGVATNNLGGRQQMWIAVGSSSSKLGTIQWSSNTSNWYPITSGGFLGFGRGIAYGNGLWVAVGDSTYLSVNPQETIQWSLDGSNWNSSITGGFTRSGTAVGFNGKTWIATGCGNNTLNSTQISIDGSNWIISDNYLGTNTGPNCIVPGILHVTQSNYTFLTNSEIITNTIGANYVNISNALTANYILSPNTVMTKTAINHANVSNLTANYGNIGDFYSYSYIKNILFINSNSVFVAIGSSKDGINTVEVTNDGMDWSGMNSGGFSPIISYGNTRITKGSSPSAILYNSNLNKIIVYALTNESINNNDYSSTIQYSYGSNSQLFTTYTGINTLNNFILENINNGLYFNGNYILLTSISESPILISQTMGTFFLGAAFNATYRNFLTGNNASTLSAVYGFYQSPSKVFVVGTANNSYTGNGNSPIFFTTDGTNFYIPYASGTIVQSNMPPTFYDITMDTNNNILFMVGAGVPNGLTSLSTFMYSLNSGVTWYDGGLEGVVSARSVSWGFNPTTGSNTITIACESTTLSNTVITYSYRTTFSPFVPDTLSGIDVISLLYSGNSGSNFISSATTGFDYIGNAVTYDGTSAWYAVGANIPDVRGTVLTSSDGSNWSQLNLNGYNPINIAGYGALKVTILGANLLYVVGKSSYSNSTVCFGSIDSGFYSGLSALSGCFDSVGYGIAYNGTNLLVAVGQGQTSGTILYKNNLANLSNNSTGAFDLVGYGVAYNNNLWIAVGQSSSTSNILYSKNGSNWSNASYGSFDVKGQGIAYGNGLWIAVGQGVATSNILYSSDGSNWFNSKTPTFSKIGYGVTWDGVKNYVATGDSGTLFSGDGSNWSSTISGDFKYQSTIRGALSVVGSVGRGVASDGAGKVVVVGAASNTNRIYRWSNASLGFTSLLSEDGLTVSQTYLATKAIYNPLKGNFIIGGLTNNTNTCIINGLNSWCNASYTSFNAVNELQFINSSNRSLVSMGITTDNLYASNAYVSNSLNVKNNTTTILLNTSNVYSSNIWSSNVWSSNISTNNLTTNNITITSNVIASSINTIAIQATTATFTNMLVASGNITNLQATNVNASFFTGNGSGLTNVTANNLADKGGSGYDIRNTNFTGCNFYGTFWGSLIGGAGGSVSQENVICSTITVKNQIYSLGNISLTGSAIISGNGSGLTNVTASNLQNNINQNIGTGTFTATSFTGAFIGDGSRITNLPSAAVANSATTATYATTAGTATYASLATASGFTSQGDITASGSFKISNTIINSNIITSNIQGNEITVTGGINSSGLIVANSGITTKHPSGGSIVIYDNAAQPGIQFTAEGKTCGMFYRPGDNVFILGNGVNSKLFVLNDIGSGGTVAGSGIRSDGNITAIGNIVTTGGVLNASALYIDNSSGTGSLNFYKANASGLFMQGNDGTSQGTIYLTGQSLTTNVKFVTPSVTTPDIRGNGTFSWGKNTASGNSNWGSLPDACINVPNSHIVISGANRFLYIDNGLNVTGLNPLSILAQGYILSGGSFTTSDKRLKKNIKPAKSSLDIVNKLKLYSYDYIDNSDGCAYDHGLLAQELKEVYPSAVKQIPSFVPDISIEATSVTNNSGTVIITLPKAHNLIIGDSIKINITRKKDIERCICDVIQINSATSFTVKEWEKFNQSENVFVYGKGIDDLMYIDKSAVGMLALGASQELSKQVTALQEENQMLRKILNKHTELLKQLMKKK